MNARSLASASRSPYAGHSIVAQCLSLLAFTIAALLLVAGSAAPSAQASVPIYRFTAQPSSTALQAGAHPDVVFSFALGNRQKSLPNSCVCHDAKDVTVHLPTGLIGNPHSTPQCTISQFVSSNCPPDSQLGVSEDAFTGAPGFGPTSEVGFSAPVYNLIPPPDQPALLAFETVLSTYVLINIDARTESDYGVDSTVSDINHTIPLATSKTVIWGVPASPFHDDLRWGRGQLPYLKNGIPSMLCDESEVESTDDPATMSQLCSTNRLNKQTGVFGYGGIGPIGTCDAACGSNGPGHSVPSNSPEIPFFQNPTTCGETSLATSLDVLAFDGGTTHADSLYPATTDCAQLAFNPSQAIEPTTTAADSPSGAEFRLTVPQYESPSVPSPSELRAATVTFPAGFSFAPNVTNGKTTCSDAEARYATREEARCPENSKIGTLSVETPILPGVLPGAVYLGEPKPGNRFRLVLTFDGFGVHVKLFGNATPDPKTGQIVFTFADLPQAPFADFNMHIFGSERGPLDTPTQCGTYEVKSEWTPWDSALSNQTSRQFFDITEGPNGAPCPNGPRPLHPGFQAASASSTAGAHTDFSLNLTRNDGDQNLSAVKVTTPPGFAASLKGTSYCPEAAIAAAAADSHSAAEERSAPSCPASSLLGEVTAGAGPGSHPLYLSGKAYLAGPYKKAPLSLVIITPVLTAGYDLGNVLTRAAIEVNPATAQVTTVSDPLPQIFAGVPLRLRQIFVNLNRPGFALNPTNCDPFAVDATLGGDEGAQASLSNHFQVANCASLPYQPDLSLKLSGGVRRRGHPAIHVVFQAKPGEANTKSLSLALPKGELLDNAHIKSPCTRAQFTVDHCPPGSILGHAEALSPLLGQPLEGPVYLATGFGHKLPDLIIALRGQLDFNLDARIDTVNGGSLRTTIDAAPDVPVSSVTLDLAGGPKGLIQNSRTLCDTPKRAALSMTGQNGKTLTKSVPLQAACGSKSKSPKRHGKRRAATHLGTGR
jgi:hypothetical protein